MGDVIDHLGTLLAPPVTHLPIPAVSRWHHYWAAPPPLPLSSPAPSFSQPKKKQVLRDVYLCSTAGCFISHVHTLFVST